MCQAAAGFVFGVGYMLTKEKYILLAAGILSVMASFELIRKRRFARMLIQGGAFLAMLLTGMRVTDRELTKIAAYQAYIGEKQPVACQGRIYRKEVTDDQTVLYLKDCIFQVKSVNYSCNHILVYFDTGQYPIGKTIVVKGVLYPLSEARNEGNFDEKAYYRAKQIDFKVKQAKLLGIYGETNWFAEKLFALAERLKRVYQKEMSPQNAGVMMGMVLGDKSQLDSEIKTMYQKSGLSHVLCVSGLHLSVIGLTSYRFLKKRGGTYRGAGLFAGSLVFCFAYMSGFDVSARRAFLMFLFLLAADGMGRSYDSLTALAAAGVLLLGGNPFLLFYPGFLFSFAAVTGVVVAGKALAAGFLPEHALLKNILTSAGIQLMTLPLVCSFYYEIPVYAVWINLILLPFMGVVLGCGLIGGILGTAVPRLAHLILWLPDLLLLFYEKVCGAFLALPCAQWITGSPGRARLIVYYGLLAVLLFSAGKRTEGQKSTGMRKRLCLGGGMVMLVGILLFPHKKQMEIDVLDVGQGDGIYLCTSDGISMFFDGGSSSVSGVGTYRILPFLKAKGVRRIDYWFVSHTDADHINGLEEILQLDYPIGTVVFPEYGYRDASLEKLEEEIERNGIMICYLKAKESLRTKNDRITCIFPTADYPVEDANAGSMVLLYETEGFRGLFTGDISKAEEEWLTEKTKLPELSFYKAAHHGSNYSNSEDFLKVLSPEVCVVSCGANNRYGHPGKDAVAHMEAYASEICYTMKGGRIRIRKTKEGFAVQNYGKPLEEKVYPVLK